MGDVVTFPISLDSDLGRELIVCCCRFAEGILTEQQVRKKFRFDAGAWEALGSNEELIEKIEAEKLRRMRDGSTKREKSQQLITKAPDILDSIASDISASPRHRVDAIKTLDSFTGGPEQNAPAADRFIISIVLSGDGVPHTEHYNKSIKPDADDIDPDKIGGAPMIAAIAVKKPTDDGNEQPV